MKEKEILTVTERALGESRKVEILFKKGTPDAFTALWRLTAMVRSGGVMFKTDMYYANALCVVQSKNWDGDHNRRMQVSFTDHFDKKWFADKLHDAVETITVLPAETWDATWQTEQISFQPTPSQPTRPWWKRLFSLK